MKHTYQYLKLAVSAAVMAMLFSGTVLGAGKEGPGMAEGSLSQDCRQEASSDGIVVQRKKKAESGDGKTENQVSQVMDGKPDLPGVSVDSLEGLTYDIRQLNVSKAEDVEQIIVIAGHDGTYARVTLYQKNKLGTEPESCEWTALVDTEGRMGRKGMGKEAEGDAENANWPLYSRTCIWQQGKSWNQPSVYPCNAGPLLGWRQRLALLQPVCGHSSHDGTV